jgi:5'(3')-deoxyribonucleotidase
MIKLLLDIDDVCADLIDCWLSLYRISSHHQLYKKDITDWDISKFILPEFKDIIYKIIEDPYIYNNIKPIDGALEGYNYLKNKKDANGNPVYEIFFATHSTIGCSGRKYEWLIENGFDVDHHHYIEIYDKSLLSTDIMIDDNFNNVANAQGIGILFNSPWNEKYYDWYPRAYNWKDVIDIIEGAWKESV